MGNSIGLIELKSTPIGIQTADEMIKSASVELLLASPICPGKYVVIVSGNVGAVKSAMQVGIDTAGTFLVSDSIINNVHKDIPAAISGTSDSGEIKAIGALETISALTSITAGDIAVKASNVRLIEIRIARGLGGKGFVIFTGEISSVKSAVNACLTALKSSGEITSYSILASPHKDLIAQIM